MKYITLLFSIVYLLTLSGCAVNPHTGKRQFNIVSEKEEIKIGTMADESIKRTYGIYQDPEIQNYVQKVGKKVANNSTRPDIEYYFTVLDSPIINAFALPGGFVYVTRGALAQMNSEAELAFVLGHEIGHIAGKHGAQRISQARALSVVFLTAAVLADTNSRSYSDYNRVANKIAELAVQGYGRQNEYESDLLGIDYSLNANYNAEEGSKFLSTLKKQEQYEMGWLAQMHASHPPTELRIERAKEKIQEELPSSSLIIKQLKISKNEYLDQIDGLFMGNSTASGIHKDNTYYNLQYLIKFSVPKKIKLNGLIDENVMSYRYKNDYRGKMGIINRRESLKDLIKQNNLKPNEENSITYHQTNQTHPYCIYETNSEKQQYIMLINGPEFAYRFEFEILNRENTKENIKKLFDSISFITEKEFEELGAYRLKIFTAKQPISIEEVALKFFNDKTYSKKIAAFNNISEKTILTAGEKIKIPQKTLEKKNKN